MEYRGIEYRYLEWTASSGKKASCYTCRDKSLLNGLGLEEISSEKHSDIKELISYYIDMRPTLLKAVELERSAHKEFYNKLNYKGD